MRTVAQPARNGEMSKSGKAGPVLDRGARKQDIYRAAAHLFAEKGYHATSMQDIADEVGLLKGSLYHHIGSKEELLRHVLLDGIYSGLSDLERIRALDYSPSQQLRLALRSLIVNLISKPEAVRIFDHDIRTLVNDGFADLLDKVRLYRELVEEIIRQGVDSREFRPVDVEIAALALLGAGNWVYTWYHPEGRLRGEEIADIFADIILWGLEK